MFALQQKPVSVNLLLLGKLNSYLFLNAIFQTNLQRGGRQIVVAELAVAVALARAATVAVAVARAATLADVLAFTSPYHTVTLSRVRSSRIEGLPRKAACRCV